MKSLQCELQILFRLLRCRRLLRPRSPPASLGWPKARLPSFGSTGTAALLQTGWRVVYRPSTWSNGSSPATLAHTSDADARFLKALTVAHPALNWDTAIPSRLRGQSCPKGSSQCSSRIATSLKPSSMQKLAPAGFDEEAGVMLNPGHPNSKLARLSGFKLADDLFSRSPSD